MTDLINIEELYENAPCAYFSILPDGQIIKANKTFLKWVGFEPEELTEYNFVDILHKGNRIYFEMIFLPMLKMQGFINEINFDIQRKDGSIFPALINAVSVKDDNEYFKAINLTLINISDRKKYEKELLHAKKEAEKEKLKFETLSNQIPEIIWTALPSGEIQFVNSQFEFLTEFTYDKEKIFFISDLIYEKDLEEFKEKWAIATKRKDGFELQLRLKKKYSNTPDWYLLRTLPLVKDKFAEEFEYTWIGTFANINEHVKSMQLKDDFISIASHELKTPITVIKSYLELMSTVVKDETQVKLLEKCESNLEKMNNLISNLLDISKLNETQVSYSKKKEDIHQLLVDVVSSYQNTQKQHEIIFEGDLQPINVFIDRYRIEQVLDNLISNAIKYSPNANKVIVKLLHLQAQNKVKICIQDFGVGIAKKEQDKIFERYYRIPTATSFNIRGWGLGLYIIQQIAIDHKSKIKVDSEEGKGSTFSFTLDII